MKKDHHIITDNPQIAIPILTLIFAGVTGWAWYEKGFFIGLLVAAGLVLFAGLQIIFSDENLWVIRWMSYDELYEWRRRREWSGEEE